MRPATLIPLTAVLLGAAASVLPAQIPGGPIRPEPTAAIYRARVLEKTDSLLGEWRAAWGLSAADEVAERYVERALLVPPDGVPLVGRDEIERRLETLLPPLRSVQLGRLYFAASDDLAFLAGWFEIERRSGRRIEGDHTTVFRRENGDWRIRAQLFFPRAGSPRTPHDLEVGAPLGAERSAGRLGDRESWSEFYRGMFGQTNRAVASVARRLREGDLIGASGAYGADATLKLPGYEPAFGRLNAANRLRELLPRVGDAWFSVLDFEPGGQLAYAYGEYYLDRTNAEGDRERLTGPYVLLLRSSTINYHALHRPPGW